MEKGQTKQAIGEKAVAASDDMELAQTHAGELIQLGGTDSALAAKVHLVNDVSNQHGADLGDTNLRRLLMR